MRIKNKARKPKIVLMAFLTLIFSASITAPSYAGFGLGLGIGGTSATGEVTRVLAPATLTGLVVTGDASAPTFTWATPVSTTTNPVWSIGTYLDGTLIATLAPTATTYTFTAVTSGAYPGTNHTFAVMPYNGFNSGTTASTVIQVYSPTVNASYYSCPSGGTLSGTTCTTTGSYVATGTTVYSCPSGGSLSGTTCYTNSAATPNTTYSCPSGGILAGSYCYTNSAATANTTYSCSSGTLSGSTCINGGSQASTLLSAAYYTCASGTVSGADCLTTAASIHNHWFCSSYTNYGSGCYTDSYYSATTTGTTATNSCSNAGGSLYGSFGSYDCRVYRAAATDYQYCTSGTPAGPQVGAYTCTITNVGAGTWHPATYYCPIGTLSGSTCYYDTSATATTTYSCPSGTLSGSTCLSSGSYSATGTTTYSCPSGGSLSGTTCLNSGAYAATGTTTYSCASGTLSGTTCVNSGSYVATGTTTYSCPSGGSLSGTTCNTTSTYVATLNPSTTTCASTGSLQTTTTCTIKVS